MTTPRQTAAQISAAIVAQIETSMATVIPIAPKSFIRVLSKTLGGIWVLLYQFAGFAILQTFVRTASNKPVTLNGVTITPLQEHGAAVGVYQGTGQAAEHTITVTVLSQGGTLTSGSKLVNTANQILYFVLGDVALNAATVTATVRAVEIGDAANMDPGTVISFVSAQSGVAKDAVILARTVEGSDAETTEDFRQRVIDRYAARPQGGATADYRDWGQGVTGVKRIYPYSGGTHAGSGPGQVDVYVESSTDPDGIADAPLLAAVKEAIELDTDGIAYRRPINAYVNTYSIDRLTFDVIISGLSSPDDIAAQAAIEDALTDYFLSREPWITGLSILPRLDIVSQSEMAGVVGRVAASVGGLVVSASLRQNGSEISLYSLQEGEKAKVGVVYWT